MKYMPTNVPDDFKGMPGFIRRELLRLQQLFVSAWDGVRFLARGAAPDKLEDGAVVYADGTNWNPGSGAGLYLYKSSAWSYLGSASVALSAVTYTTTGTLTAAPIISLAQPAPAQIAGVVQTATGKWVSGLILDATNQQLTTISFTDIQGFVAAGNSPIINAVALTSVSWPALTHMIGSFGMQTDLPLMTALDLSALVYVSVNFTTGTFALLTTLTLTALQQVGGVFGLGTYAVLTTISCPALTMVGTNFQAGFAALCTTYSFPVLATVGGNFTPRTMAVLTTIAVNALTDIGGTFTPTAMAALTSFSITSLVRVGANVTSGTVIGFTSGTAALATLSIGSGLKQVGNGAGNVVLTSCALLQASVDALLVALAALDGTNGTTTFNNRTVTITGTSAAPSATGVTAKNTLIARGCTVTTN